MATIYNSYNNSNSIDLEVGEGRSEEAGKQPAQESRYQRICTYLNQVEKNIPSFQIQGKVDQLAKEIKEKFSCLDELNDWLVKNDSEDWAERLASSLVKLPMRSAKAAIENLFSVLSAALYISVHPVTGIKDLAKSTVSLFQELTQPSNWPKIGCGTMGTLVGQSVILGNPLSFVGMMIGGALILGGISLDTYKAAVQKESNQRAAQIQEKVGHHLAQLPETMLTGIFTGMLFGGIQRAVQGANKPLKIRDAVDQNTLIKIPDVAQYKKGDWSNVVKTVRHITLEEAKKIACNDPDVTFFFYTKGWNMILESDKAWRIFHQGDAVFFSGKPWWGSAKGLADGYMKA